jgi:hypothetical protein
MPDDPDGLLPVKQVALELPCHPLTVRRMIHDGILPGEKIDGR